MIETGQSLHVKNLLSFRKVMSQDQMEEENKKLFDFIEDQKLKIVGPKISTTHFINQSGQGSIDMEILIPVDKTFEEREDYKLKKELKLVNCLSVAHIGNPADFQKKVLELQKYIKDNKLTPISNLYTLSLRDPEAKTGEAKFQAICYISINPNIL